MNLPLALAPGFSQVSANQTSGNRFNGFRRTWQAVAILLALWVGVMPASSEIYETNGLKLDVSLRFDKPEFMLGEPTWFTLQVRNLSDVELGMTVGGDYVNEVGRPDSFKIKFVAADGKPVPQPTVRMNEGGVTGFQRLAAKGSNAFRLFVPHWATFSEPGAYSVTCARRLDVWRAGGLFTQNGSQAVSERTGPVDVQETGKVRVIAANPEKFGKLIESLGHRVLNGKGDEREEAMQILTTLKDERAVPIFSKAAISGYTVITSPAIRALGNFKSDEAFEGLKRAMNLTGKDIWNAVSPEVAAEAAGHMRHYAAVSLIQCKHPEAIPFLLKFWNDDSEDVRIAVLHIYGGTDTAEALVRLQALSHDKSPRVSNEAKRYINLRTKQNERTPQNRLL